jgi:hypothetical protein
MSKDVEKACKDVEKAYDESGFLTGGGTPEDMVADWFLANYSAAIAMKFWADKLREAETDANMKKR